MVGFSYAVIRARSGLDGYIGQGSGLSIRTPVDALDQLGRCPKPGLRTIYPNRRMSSSVVPSTGGLPAKSATLCR